jgi:type II secretory pathway pseudopilin PulG
MTLIEVVTAMSIMSVLMALFTAGIVQIYRFANRHEATALARSQVNLAFLRLDKEIRYARGISVPDAVGPDQYVEYLISSDGVPTCVELRLDTGSARLQRRTWQHGVASISPTPWKDLAIGVSSPQPFVVFPADPTFAYQRLHLRLTARAGATTTAATAESSVTFTAMNTTPEAATPTVCTEGRSMP